MPKTDQTFTLQALRADGTLYCSTDPLPSLETALAELVGVRDGVICFGEQSRAHLRNEGVVRLVIQAGDGTQAYREVFEYIE